MRAGSLFSGIGGLDYGLACAGWEHAFFCESDPWRRDVLRAYWPGVPVYDDVRDVATDIRLAGGGLGEDVDSRRAGTDAIIVSEQDACCVDLLCGGFPCQDLSVAGQRRGLAGARSGLFYEFARIIDTVRPRLVLLENVPGLLSSNGGRDFGVVLGTLADIGYGVGWRVLDSRFFGVPQRRRRVFIVAARADGDTRAAAECAGQILAVGTRCTGHLEARGEAGQEPAVAAISGLGNGGPDDNDGQAGRLVASALVKRYGKGTEGVRRLTPTECERLQALPDGWTNPTGNAPDSRRYSALGDAVTASVAEWLGRRLAAAL